MISFLLQKIPTMCHIKFILLKRKYLVYGFYLL